MLDGMPEKKGDWDNGIWLVTYSGSGRWVPTVAVEVSLRLSGRCHRARGSATLSLGGRSRQRLHSTKLVRQAARTAFYGPNSLYTFHTARGDALRPLLDERKQKCTGGCMKDWSLTCQGLCSACHRGGVHWQRHREKKKIVRSWFTALPPAAPLLQKPTASLEVPKCEVATAQKGTGLRRPPKCYWTGHSREMVAAPPSAAWPGPTPRSHRTARVLPFHAAHRVRSEQCASQEGRPVSHTRRFAPRSNNRLLNCTALRRSY